MERSPALHHVHNVEASADWMCVMAQTCCLFMNMQYRYIF